MLAAPTPPPVWGGGWGGPRGREACASVAAADPHLLALLASSPFQGEVKDHFTSFLPVTASRFL
jgi:hypothetical protein